MKTKDHTDHFLQIMPKQMTVGDLRRAVKKLKIPDSATFKCAAKTDAGDGWRWLLNFSYCRTANEVSLW